MRAAALATSLQDLLSNLRPISARRPNTINKYKNYSVNFAVLTALPSALNSTATSALGDGPGHIRSFREEINLRQNCRHGLFPFPAEEVWPRKTVS